MTPKIEVLSKDSDSYTLKVYCLFDKTHSMEFKVSRSGYGAFVQGHLHIQTALAANTPDQREILISGMCNICWNKVFPSEEY